MNAVTSARLVSEPDGLQLEVVVQRDPRGSFRGFGPSASDFPPDSLAELVAWASSGLDDEEPTP